MPIKNIRGKAGSIKIDLKTAKSTGGQTGSVRVADAEGTFYQYKSPVAENSLKRRIKSNFLDKENFGEVLAARIALAVDEDPANPRVPLVSFVTDSDSPYVAIASRYLTSKPGPHGEGTVQSLDDYLGKPKGKSHIKLVSGSGNPKEGLHSIDADPILKRELARAIALSALVGDHDVNPGNMIVIKDGDDTIKVGRIDYGHAFKDLIRFSSLGGQKIHDNNIIDFFNRDTLDGFKKPKILRDYPGLIPSHEMAEALKDLASKEGAIAKIQAALNEIKDEIKEIIKDPNIDKEEVIRSFQNIAEHVTGRKINPKGSDEERLNAIFEGLEAFTKRNMEHMSYAAEVMNLQVKIREAIKNDKVAELKELKMDYDKLVSDGGIPGGSGPFSWFKEEEGSTAFKGNFNKYVEHVKKEKQLNKIAEEINQFLKGPPDPSAYEKKVGQKLQRIITNPKKTVEDKVLMLKKEIVKIDTTPQSISSWFRKIVQSINALIRPSQSAAQVTPAQDAQRFKDFKSKLHTEIKTPEAPVPDFTAYPSPTGNDT